MGEFYRRLAARIGKPEATTATARKVAILVYRIVYRVLKRELIYQDIGADGYTAHQPARVLNGLRRSVGRLGFELVTRHTEELIGAAA